MRFGARVDSAIGDMNMDLTKSLEKKNTLYTSVMGHGRNIRSADG